MRYRVQILLSLVVAAVILAGCAAGESDMPFMEGLAYDETDHTWTGVPITALASSYL